MKDWRGVVRNAPVGYPPQDLVRESLPRPMMHPLGKLDLDGENLAVAVTLDIDRVFPVT